MVARLILLFTVVPLMELWLLLRIGDRIGAGPTFALVLVTGVVGAALAKREGLRVLGDWQRALAEGRMPPDGVLGGALVLVGGVLLVTPGVVTDAVGLALLVPPTRRAISLLVRRHVQRAIDQGTVRVYTAGPPMGGPFRHRSGPFGPGGPYPRQPSVSRPGGSHPRRGTHAHEPGRPPVVIDVEGETVEERPDDTPT